MQVQEGIIEAIERFKKKEKKKKNCLKPFHFAGDSNLNILAHVKCSKVHKFTIQEWYDIKHKQAYNSNQENGYSN